MSVFLLKRERPLNTQMQIKKDEEMSTMPFLLDYMLMTNSIGASDPWSLDPYADFVDDDDDPWNFSGNDSNDDDDDDFW